jgi:6-phosphofructokinase 2
MKMKIATLTLNPALDKSTGVDRIVPDKKLRCDALQIDAGGGGINVSKGIRKLGGESTAVFPAGGATGAKLKSILQTAGIATKTVELKEDTRENISVSEHFSGVQYRFTMPGTPLSETEAAACLDALFAENPDLVVASGSMPPGLPDTYYKTVAERCLEVGAKLVIDTSGPALQAALDVGVFLLKPNLGELSALAGVEKLEMNKVDDAALEIIGRGYCEVVVVSLGPQGALLVTKDGFEHIPAPTVLKKSTVGAGDSMVAGMVWSLGQGKDYREMVQMGVACGSAATQNPGTELFKAEDAFSLFEWIQRYGERYRFTDF